MITLQKVLKQDSAQNAPDVRREIFEERGVLSVRRSDEEIVAMQQSKYSVNPLYPALKRLPFFGFQSLLVANRRGGAIWSAVETLQKANRFCGKAQMATVHRQGIFL
jgi:hypothetical protein